MNIWADVQILQGSAGTKNSNSDKEVEQLKKGIADKELYIEHQDSILARLHVCVWENTNAMWFNVLLMIVLMG